MRIAIDEQLSKQHILEISENRVEPSWLRQSRLAALEKFEQMEWPTGKEENWRHSSVRVFTNNLRFPVFSQNVRLLETLPELPLLQNEKLKAATEKSGRVYMNAEGQIFSALPENLQKKGVIITGMPVAVREFPAYVEEFFRKASPIQSESRFEALHRASWNTGFFIFIPESVALDEPIYLFSETSENEEEGFFPHNLIILEHNAAARIIEVYFSPNDHSAAFVNGFSEIHVGKSARLDLGTVVNWNDQVVHYHSSLLTLQRNAHVNWITALLGGKNVLFNLESRLTGPNSAVNMHGFYFGSGSEHFHLNTYQNHQTVQSKSDLLYKGVLKDQATSVYRGIIRVEQGAQRTDAYQANRNLLLSSEAHVHSIPVLEIEANDVRCTHGATIGQVDADQVFYLQSRGLPRIQAEKLIVDGFLNEIVKQLPDAGEEIQDLVHARINHKYFG